MRCSIAAQIKRLSRTDCHMHMSRPLISAYDHITANLPDTIRTRKSNVVELAEYSGGGPRGKCKCCMLFAFKHVSHFLSCPSLTFCTSIGTTHRCFGQSHRSKASRLRDSACIRAAQTSASATHHFDSGTLSSHRVSLSLTARDHSLPSLLAHPSLAHRLCPPVSFSLLSVLLPVYKLFELAECHG